MPPPLRQIPSCLAPLSPVFGIFFLEFSNSLVLVDVDHLRSQFFDSDEEMDEQPQSLNPKQTQDGKTPHPLPCPLLFLFLILRNPRPSHPSTPSGFP
jgi:hypothetical protein